MAAASSYHLCRHGPNSIKSISALPMTLQEIIDDIGEAIVSIDSSGERFRGFQLGVGPYGEPQLVRLIVQHLNENPKYGRAVRTKRTPDLLIPNEWALEFKIARPFGDNGKEAENWSVNLIHPYPGNVSTIGDCQKLARYPGSERRAVIVVGYEHDPPVISLTPLVQSFEVIATHVFAIKLSSRVEIQRKHLVHPVHKSLRLFAWEVLDRLRD